jgi:acetyltransferase-like isoleucine patch superfamily enzyme
MNYKFQVLLRLFRGAFFRILHVKKGGKFLRVTGKIRVNHKKNSKIILGEKVVLYKNMNFYLDAEGASVIIGSKTYINRRTEIMCKEKVEIGENCAISWDVTITDTDYHSINNNKSTSPVFIEDKVWIGCKSTILKGVRIGKGSVVAANSVVTKDVPPNCLVAGVPARIIQRDIQWS